MAAYARQAKDTELVEWATEIKVRAERRAGELVAAMPKINGRPSKASHDTRLSDLGISYDQSSRWQKLAAVPEDKFEQAVAAAKEIARPEFRVSFSGFPPATSSGSVLQPFSTVRPR